MSRESISFWLTRGADNAYTPPLKALAISIVGHYLPERMTNQRRHLLQDLTNLIERAERDARESLCFSLRSRPWYKRVWLALRNQY
jgi:hypothetical protein